MVEAIAKCNFSGNNDDLLAINAGDLIKITSFDLIEDSKWYPAYLNGKHGYVADYMIEFLPFNWFWGGCITGTEAEKSLSQFPSKKFIIRETPVDSFQFYLSYKPKGEGQRVFHFKIFGTPENLNFTFFRDFMGPKIFETLNELAYYVQNSSWYSAPWWTPYEDKDERREKDLQKLRKWSPNI